MAAKKTKARPSSGSLATPISVPKAKAAPVKKGRRPAKISTQFTSQAKVSRRRFPKTLTPT